MTTEILVTRSALDEAESTALAAMPKETGGILLGFRTPGLVVVTRSLTIPDPRSSSRTYLRRRRSAQTKLDSTFLQAAPGIGYVGEWHSHPVDQPPSPVDKQALILIAVHSGAPVALLVLSHRGKQEFHHYGMTAVREPSSFWSGRQVQVWFGEPEVTVEPAGSLEAEVAERLNSEE